MNPSVHSPSSTKIVGIQSPPELSEGIGGLRQAQPMGTERLSKIFRLLLILLISTLLMVACGGSGSSGDDLADADAVDTGKPLTNDGWSVELSRPTERAKIIGEGNLVYQSEQGVYLVVFIKVTNASGVLQVVPRDLFSLTDGVGTDYKPTKSAIQVAYVQHKGKERDLEIVLDSPMKDGETREGVVVFEVSADGSDYSLSVKDANGTLAIGF